MKRSIGVTVVTAAILFATTESAKFSVAYRELMPDQATTNLMANDEHVLTEFLQTFATYGELEAFKRLQGEKLRLQQLPGYDQCAETSDGT